MYLTAILEVDPSQIVISANRKKFHLLEKLLVALDVNEEKESEQETFTAVSILQQFYEALNKCNIDNVIRLAIDEYDFYLDDKGLPKDIDKAFSETLQKIDPIESQLFDTIYLVLEHLANNIKYLIEIRVKRKHRKGVYPIQIIINGVFTEFRFHEYMGIKDLEDLILMVMSSQNKYDNFLQEKKQVFDGFVSELVSAIKSSINIDNINSKTMFQLIRPSVKIQSISQIQHGRYSNPAYYGYYGFDNYFLYAWLWASCLAERNIYISNFCLVDDMGNEIIEFKDEGFFSNEYNTLKPELPFELPKVVDGGTVKVREM